MVLTALLCLATAGRAQNYVVTNLLDSGAGSLRDGISAANSNPGPDTIRFNIATTLPAIISPTSALPSITDSFLVIDASSQPGYYLGAVILDGTNAGAWVTGLDAGVDADYFELYGLWLRDYDYFGLRVYASDVIIGAPGKGNIFTGNYHGILVGAHQSTGGTIQSNLVGIGPDSTTAAGNDRTGIYIAPFSGSIPGNFFVGGSRSAGEGNLVGNNGWANLSIHSKTRVQGNNLGTNPNVSIAWPNGWNTIPGYNLNNIYVGSYADGSQIGGNSSDLGNAIGFQAGAPIMIQGASKVSVIRNLIMGTTAATGSSWPGVRVYNEDSVLISRNSFRCNQSGISLFAGGNQNKAAPVITTALSNTIIGTATAGDSIEVFAHDNSGCNWSTPACQGRTFLGGTRAVANGVWTINGTFSFTEVTATATETEANRTSSFATCRPINYVLEETAFVEEHIRQKSSVFEIYPNPAQSKVCLRAPVTDPTPTRYFVLSLDGKKVLQGSFGETNEQCLNIENFSPGLYRVLMHAGDQYQALSFVKD